MSKNVPFKGVLKTRRLETAWFLDFPPTHIQRRGRILGICFIYRFL